MGLFSVVQHLFVTRRCTASFPFIWRSYHGSITISHSHAAGPPSPRAANSYELITTDDCKRLEITATASTCSFGSGSLVHWDTSASGRNLGNCCSLDWTMPARQRCFT